jgi:hypothetical protein
MVTKRCMTFLRIILLYVLFGFYEPTAGKLIKLRRTPLGFCIIRFGVRHFQSSSFIPKAEKLLTVTYIGLL